MEEIPRSFYNLGKCCKLCKVCFLVVYLEMFDFLFKFLVYKYAISASLIFKTKSDQIKTLQFLFLEKTRTLCINLELFVILRDYPNVWLLWWMFTKMRNANNSLSSIWGPWWQLLHACLSWFWMNLCSNLRFFWSFTNKVIDFSRHPFKVWMMGHATLNT